MFNATCSSISAISWRESILLLNFISMNVYHTILLFCIIGDIWRDGGNVTHFIIGDIWRGGGNVTHLDKRKP